jgi:hypothetical protein
VPQAERRGSREDIVGLKRLIGGAQRRCNAAEHARVRAIIAMSGDGEGARDAERDGREIAAPLERGRRVGDEPWDSIDDVELVEKDVIMPRRLKDGDERKLLGG